MSQEHEQDPSEESREQDASSVVFWRCDEFMKTAKKRVAVMSFYDENDDEIEGVIHAWPLSEKMVPFFLAEEKQVTPERNYYQVTPPENWYVFALNWVAVDRYVTNIELASVMRMPQVLKPKIEVFDPQVHIGEVVPENDKGILVRVPYQVVFSPRPITYLE